MWNTDTAWFDLALLMAVFAFGNILLGHFEEHRSKLRRVAKVVLFSTILVLISTNFGRFWLFLILGLMGLGALYIHAWWLPKHGINGLTAEPRDKYLELIGHKK